MGTHRASNRRIETVVSLDCHDGSRTSLVSARFGYHARDPYAVTITFLDRAPGMTRRTGVTWTIARELLRGGMGAPSGEGDVRVWPENDARRRALLAIEFNPGTGPFTARAHLRDIHTFLTRTYAEVPLGTEGHHLDIDGLVHRIFQPEIR